MNNPFPYSDSNKRYHTFNYFLRHHFGCKVAKVSLDAGFTCPNLDGTKGTGGCTYCSSRGSGDFAGDVHLPLDRQFEQVRQMMDHKWEDTLYIPYFQAHTNTYAPLPVLREKFEQALNFPNVTGLAIATRADCISDETADYLGELAQRTYLEVELGLQTIHDVTGQRINRCHSYADFLRGYQKLRDRGVQVCVHIIDGLPGEDHQMMLETARELSRLSLHSIKIHLLHVLKGTVMAEQLQRGEFRLLEREEYVNIVCDQLELLPPELIVQRVTGDGEKEALVGPMWSLKKLCVLNEIDKELVRRDSWQGKFYQK